MDILSLFLNIMLLISGALILIIHKKNNGGISLIILSVLFIICGICGIVSFSINSYSCCMASIFFPTGLVCIFAPVYSLVQVCSCKFLIKAEYLRSEVHVHKGGSSYTPIFRYSFNGNEYESPVSAAYLFKKRLERKYTSGDTYEIRINEKHPEKCVDRYYVPLIQYFSFAFGLILLSSTALCLINFFG